MNGATILLGYFLILLFLFIRWRNVTMLLIGIQFASLAGTFLLGQSVRIETGRQVWALVIIGMVLTCFILPWVPSGTITRLIVPDEWRLRRVTQALIAVSTLPFVVLLITAVFVVTRVDDVNDFKYTDGVSTEFYYNLPINVKLIILSNFLYSFAYFLIPLHLFYLSRRKFILSAVCFVFSLNIVLYGMTFFSRWALTHYLMIYLAMLVMMSPMLEARVKTVIKWVVAVLALVFIAYFVSITNQRFKYDEVYHRLVRSDAVVQSPIAYSYISYVSQSYEYGVDLVASYNGQSFGGQTSLYPILSLMGQYRLLKFDENAYNDLRRWTLGDCSDKFIGLVAYLLYDFGYIGIIVLCIVYVAFMRRIRPRGGAVRVDNLFHYVLLIQLPLFAIFYSFIAGILIPYLMLLPILVYLRGGRANSGVPRRHTAPLRTGNVPQLGSEQREAV